MIARRSFLLGLGSLFAAPAIIKIDSLMRLSVPKKAKLVVYCNKSIRNWIEVETIRDRNVLLTYSDVMARYELPLPTAQEIASVWQSLKRDHEKGTARHEALVKYLSPFQIT